MNSSSCFLWIALVLMALAPDCALAQVSTNPLPGRVLVKLLADPVSPLVYALNAGDGTTAGSLLALDASTGAVVGEVATGRYPTDLTLGGFGSALYVINTGSRTIARYEPQTLALVNQKAISTPGTYDPANPLHLAAGRDELLYFTDGAWAPTVTVFDFAQGQVVSSYSGDGVGGLAVRREGNDLYVWRQYGWGAGNVNSYVTHLDIRGTTPAVLESSFVSGRRDPFDTPILFDAAERWVFNKQQMFDARDLSVVVNQFRENLYAVSLDGSVAFGSTRVFNTQTTREITNLVVESSVQVLSADQKRLFRWAPGSGLVIHDMAAIASVAGPDPVPVPADGAVLGEIPLQLSWSASPTALAYDVYYADTAAAVAAAGTNSPVHLVRTNGWTLDLPTAPLPGQVRYWRVDRVGVGGQIRQGPVWSFTVSPLQVNPSRVDLLGIQGHSPKNRILRIVTSGIPWTARVTGEDWLRVSPGSGSSSGDLTLEFNTTNLPVGSVTNAVEVAFQGLRLVLPVELSVKALAINRMTADPGAPWIYATQPGSQPGQTGYLLRIHVETGAIDDLLPIGGNPTDLAVHPRERRLYVANWGNASSEVVDLETFRLLPPLQMGTDVYRINPGPKGRVIIEGYDQWIGVSLRDSATGTGVGNFPFPQREGDGETSPDGTFYYHADNNISNASIHKYSIGSLTAVAHSPEHPYGSRNLVLSGDGTRVFWQGSVFNADLIELGALGAQILAASRDGSLAISADRAFDVADRLEMASLPSTASVGVVDSSDLRFWYFDSAAAALRSVSLDTLRAPSITVQPVSQTVREGEPVYLKVTARGLGPLSYQWTHAGTNLVGATNQFLSISRLDSSNSGTYRVTVANGYGKAVSDPAEVIALNPPRWSASPADTNVLAGGTLVLTAEAVGTPIIRFAWLRDGLLIPGATTASLIVSNVQSSHEGLYQIRASNAVGVAISPFARVRVLPSAPRIVGQPVPQTVRAGSSARFEALVEGSMTLSFQWFSNGVPILGATERILQIPEVQVDHGAIYRLTASNALGVASSQPVRLQVLESSPVIVEQPVDQTVAAGSRARVAARVEGSAPLTFQWYRDGAVVPGGTGAALVFTNVTGSVAGFYRLEVSNALGRATSTEAHLVVHEAPVVVKGLAPTLASRGASVGLAVEVRAVPPPVFSWTRNGVPIPGAQTTLTLPSVGPADSGLYSVIVTNGLGAVTNSALLIVQAPPSGVGTWGDTSGWPSTPPEGLVDALAVVGGDYHSVALRSDGSLSAWGVAMDGRTRPPEVGRRWFAIAAGEAHTVGVLEDGSLAGFGRNEAHQLDFPPVPEPVVAVAAGDAHSLALTSRGRVLVWGENALGQLEAPPVLRQLLPRSDSPMAAIRIAAGRHHSLALLNNGSVVAWGGNLAGESTVPPGLSDVVDITAGRLHSVALTRGGTVVVWGDNSYQQAQVPVAVRDVVAIAAGDFHTVALRRDGSVVAWGDGSLGQCTLPSGLQGVVGIGAGYYHGLALVPSGPRLRWERVAGGLRFFWGGGFILQSAISPAGPYSDLSHGEQEWGPVPVDAMPTRFFRLRE